MSTVTEKLVTFARLILRAETIRKAQTETADDFVGCEVLEQSPSGAYIVAVITDIWWESAALPANWQKGQPQGDWMIKIRYIASGHESWTSQEVLTLTGTKYDDAGAAVIQAARDAQKRMVVSHE